MATPAAYEVRASGFITTRLRLPRLVLDGQWAGEVFDQELRAFLAEGAALVERLIQRETPEGATAQLRGTAFAEMRGDPVRTIVAEWPAAYAEVALRGRRPGKGPPPGALDAWVRRVLGVSGEKAVRAVAFLVGRKIARRGTPGDPFLHRVQVQAEGRLQRMLDSAASRIARRLEGR